MYKSNFIFVILIWTQVNSRMFFELSDKLSCKKTIPNFRSFNWTWYFATRGAENYGHVKWKSSSEKMVDAISLGNANRRKGKKVKWITLKYDV